MIPLRDNIPSRTVPVVNYVMIAVCVAVFLLQRMHPDEMRFVEQLGMVPARVLDPDASLVVRGHEPVPTRFGIEIRETVHAIAPAAVPNWLTLLTCIFLHGGWLHLLGNLWFLWIFGDNVEDRIGHGRYLAFYLLCGVAASTVHLFTNGNSAIPTIGASGAIAGVMGAYFVLYPRAQVLTLVPLIFFFDIWVLPAPAFLGVWFILQILQGSFALGAGDAAGVAWWAHIGGFAVGVAIAMVLAGLRKTRPAVRVVRPGTDGFRRYHRYGVRGRGS
jgi:membrane associated rhomboid family serine protease